MTGKYKPLEEYLRGLPASPEEVTLTFIFIKQILNAALPASAQQEHSWWGNQKQGTKVAPSPKCRTARNLGEVNIM
jgi:hypothetical protein